MSVHGLVSPVRRIPCKFTCIEKRSELICKFLRHTAFQQSCHDVFLVQILGTDIELVRDETEKCLMKFLVECGIQILLQEITGYLKTGQCHLGRLPVSSSDHIGLPGLHSTHHNPDNRCCGNQKYHTYPISERLDEEMSLVFVRRDSCTDETDILSQIPDAFPVRHDNS